MRARHVQDQVVNALLDAFGKLDTSAVSAAWAEVTRIEAELGQARVDAAAAVHGGCIWFTKRTGVEPVKLARDLSLAIAVAGPPASTKEMVEGVARLRERRPEVVNQALDGIAALVRNAKLCIEAGDVSGLGKLMDLNQMLPSGLFLSTEGIELACELARKAGALGAKLTGAGGGGSVVALVDEDADPMGLAVARKGADPRAGEAFGDRLHPLGRPPVVAQLEAGADRAAEDQRTDQRSEVPADGPGHPLVHQREPPDRLPLAHQHPALERQTDGLEIGDTEARADLVGATGVVQPRVEIARADREREAEAVRGPRSASLFLTGAIPAV